MSQSPKAGHVVYLGHVPHGFYEEQMMGFFSQFGDVQRVRLSRSKKTGRSRGFAFIEFDTKKNAATAAQVMDNYPLFGRTMVSRIVDKEHLHADLFKGANNPFQKIEWRKMAQEKHNGPKTAEQQTGRVTRLLAKEAKKRKALEALGIDYDFAGYSSVAGAPSTAAAAPRAASTPAPKKKRKTEPKKAAAKAKPAKKAAPKKAAAKKTAAKKATKKKSAKR
jgi:nucleolar protein 15